MTENPSILAARTIVGSLIGAGVGHVVYCPGSRDAPFAYALADLGGLVGTTVAIDERSAGFYCVGLARAGVLAAVITTSGTAVTELHPAVAEASHARLPLVVVSADRPFELRGVGASQTTDQVGLFASHVRGTWDIPAGAEDAGRLAGLVARAAAAARGAPTGAPGPVHINVGLRDPLVPAGTGGHRVEAPVPAGRAPLVAASAPRATPWEEAVPAPTRGVVVAGDGADPGAVEWARRAGMPLFAEPSSGVHAASRPGGVLAHQQAALTSELAERIETVVLTGRPTLSRAVNALLARPDVRLVVVDPHPQWSDPAANADTVVAALAPPTVGDGAEQRENTGGAGGVWAPPGWLRQWEQQDRAARAAINALVVRCVAQGAPPTMFEVARAVEEASDGPLVLGASNPVRAVDLVCAELAGRRIHSNRGLAGIDGTIATAAGIARGLGASGAVAPRIVVLLGDLAFFHDASSLALAAAEGAPLDIVVADDHGGGIFATLEHGRREHADLYDRWFGAGQSTDIAALAAAYGARYQRLDADGLRGALRTGADGGGVRVLHVPISRAAGLYATAGSAAALGLAAPGRI